MGWTSRPFNQVLGRLALTTSTEFVEFSSMLLRPLRLLMLRHALGQFLLKLEFISMLMMPLVLLRLLPTETMLRTILPRPQELVWATVVSTLTTGKTLAKGLS